MKILGVSITRSCVYGMLTLLSGMPSLLSAQGNAAAPGFISVRILHQVPSEQANLEAALADLARIQGTNGMGFLHVYQSVRGPGGYMVVTPDPQFSGQPAPPPASDALATALRRAGSALMEPARTLTVRVFPELSIGGGQGPTAPPPSEFMRVRVTTAAPSNSNAVFAWQRDQLVPALTKAGGNRRGGRVVAGGNVNEFVEFAYMKQLGRTDWNLPESMGQKNFDQMVGRIQSLTASEQIFWYRFRPDLSFSSTPR